MKNYRLISSKLYCEYFLISAVTGGLSTAAGRTSTTFVEHRLPICTTTVDCVQSTLRTHSLQIVFVTSKIIQS